MPKMVYLDHNATSHLRPAVASAVSAALAETGNPSSIHLFGRNARQRVEQAREKIASFIGCTANQLIFTSGGTEANNTAILCSGRKRILVGATEHDSVRRAQDGIQEIPVDAEGVIRLDELDKMLTRNAGDALVSVMLANNETGVIQPVAEIAALAKSRGAIVHCDAVQALGKMNLRFADSGCDMMTLSAHKIGGPSGIGVLVFSDRVALTSYLKGGGQERSRRAGTENVAAICGFGALIDDLSANMALQIQTMQRLRLKMESEIMAQGSRTIAGFGASRLPNTTSVVWTGLRSELQIMKLDLAGVAVSSGSACSSGKVKPSHVLQAMGFGAEQASSVLRVSCGWNTTENDIDEFLAAYLALDKANAQPISQTHRPPQSVQFI